MVFISSLVVAASIVGFCVHKESRYSHRDWYFLATMVSIVEGILILVLFASTSDGADEDYTTVVNGDKFYCERGVYTFDASYVWPGWVVEHHSDDDAEAVCYFVRTIED